MSPKWPPNRHVMADHAPGDPSNRPSGVTTSQLFFLGETRKAAMASFSMSQRATSPFPVEASHFESGLKDGESRWVNRLKASRFWGRSHTLVPLTQNRPRSEERRVGEECRSPRAPD